MWVNLNRIQLKLLRYRKKNFEQKLEVRKIDAEFAESQAKAQMIFLVIFSQFNREPIDFVWRFVTMNETWIQPWIAKFKRGHTSLEVNSLELCPKIINMPKQKKKSMTGKYDRET